MNIINKRNEIDIGSGGTKKGCSFFQRSFHKPRCFSGAVKGWGNHKRKKKKDIKQEVLLDRAAQETSDNGGKERQSGSNVR